MVLREIKKGERDMYKGTAAWVDMHSEYKSSLNKIKEVKKNRKGTGLSEDIADCEIAGSMENDLTQSVREMKKRVLQEYNAISEEDINNPVYRLTEKQKQIILLRLNHSCREISEKIGVEQSTIYNIYQTAANKIISVKSKQKAGYIVGLSEQQNNIVALMNKGYKNKEIALKLGISESTVKVQKSRLKKRLTKP